VIAREDPIDGNRALTGATQSTTIGGNVGAQAQSSVAVIYRPGRSIVFIVRSPVSNLPKEDTLLPQCIVSGPVVSRQWSTGRWPLVSFAAA
jgi:hypothetical protein